MMFKRFLSSTTIPKRPFLKEILQQNPVATLGLGIIVGSAFGFCLSARDFEEKLLMVRMEAKKDNDAVLMDIKKVNDAVRMEAKKNSDAVLMDIKKVKDALLMEVKKDTDAVLMEDILLAEERVKKMLDRRASERR